MKSLASYFLSVVFVLSFSENVFPSEHDEQLHSKPNSGDEDGAAKPHLLQRGPNEFTFWSGVSFDSPSGMFLGVTEDRAFFVASLQYARMLAANKYVGLAYTIDAIPLAIVTNNPGRRTISVTPAKRTSTAVRKAVYGVGLAPLGIKLYLVPAKRTIFFMSACAGVLSFLDEVPEPEARKVNFTFELGAGLQVATTSRWALTLGYKLHHLSNANTAFSNPGLDANIFYLGFTAFR